MKQITAEDLKRIVLSLKLTPELERVGITALNLQTRMYHLALRLLDHFMEEEWVKRNVVCKDGGADPFRASADSLERYKNFVRVGTFAEMLLNFQDVEGFSPWCRELRSRNNVEAGLAEIQGAALLHATGLKFRFRNTEGHDLDILLAGGDAAAEIKRRVETTDLTDTTIYNALHGARSQLPADRAGFVFLNIPDDWPSNPDINDVFSAALNKLFKETQRITTVFVWWEGFSFPETGGSWRSVLYREEKNPNARFSAGPVTDLAPFPQKIDIPWMYLDEIILEIIPSVDPGGFLRLK